MISNKTFNILRGLAEIFIPALAVFYATLSAIWQLPYSNEVTKTCVAIETIIGALVTYLRYINQNANDEVVDEDVKAD